jgi:tetratricopeptide (TPR) repeat protein
MFSLRLLFAFCAAAAPVLAQTQPQSEPSPAAVVRHHFDAAERAQREGDPLRAESEYRQVLGQALEQLGQAYSILAELDPAGAAFRGAAEARADSEAALLGLATTYLRKNEFQKGVDAVRTFLAQKPRSVRARLLLGKLYFGLKQFDAAQFELQEVQRLAPTDTETAVTLAFTYLEQKQPEKVEKMVSTLIPQVGDSAEIHILFGIAFRQYEYFKEAAGEFRRAIKANPEYPRVHYYLALTDLSEEGNHSMWPEAEAELQEELRRRPKDFRSEYLLGLLYVQDRKLEQAVPPLERAVQLEPNSPDAALYLGQTLYLLGHLDKGLPLLERAIALTKDPSRNNYQVSKAHYLLGQALSRQGKTQEAQRHLALVASYKSKQNVEDQERLRIRMASQEGLHDPADPMQRRAVLIAPDPPPEAEQQRLRKVITFYAEVAGNAYNQLGLLRARESDFARAAYWLEGAERWKPDLPDLQLNAGLAQFKVQNYTAAIPHLEKAVAAQPARPDARMLLGLSYFYSENYRRVLEILAPIRERAVQDPQVAYAVGLSLVFAGNRELGIEMLNSLVTKYPQSADAHMALGRAQALRGDLDHAVAEFSKALELDATVPDGHYSLGLALLKRGQRAEAAAEFRREIERNPRHAKAQYHLGYALTLMEQPGDAVRQFEQAIKLDPSYTDAWYELGKAQLRQGQVNDAVANLEKAAQLQGDRSYIQYQLSQAYLKAGRLDAAKTALARYRELKARESAQTPPAGRGPEPGAGPQQP